MLILYEIMLQNGLRHYILNSPRDDIISANREGIFGCLGYTSIYFMGVYFGRKVNQTIPLMKSEKKKLEDDIDEGK
jgi:hypothetical protein